MNADKQHAEYGWKNAVLLPVVGGEVSTCFNSRFCRVVGQKQIKGERWSQRIKGGERRKSREGIRTEASFGRAGRGVTCHRRLDAMI